MTSITCLMATVLALLTIPLVIIWRLSLTKQQNARRLRSTGLPYKAIGLKLHMSSSTAWKYCQT
jgi:ABC-type spermidine/putrescine transport system permease subunit II